MNNLDTCGRNYLRLTLEINKHFDGFIDAYLGPADLKAEVEAAPQREPAALLEDVAQLQASVPTADPRRHAYLSATLRAIETTARTVAPWVGKRSTISTKWRVSMTFNHRKWMKPSMRRRNVNWIRCCQAAVPRPNASKHAVTTTLSPTTRHWLCWSWHATKHAAARPSIYRSPKTKALTCS